MPCWRCAASGRRSSSPPLSAASPTAMASTRSPAKLRRKSSRPPAIPRSFPSSQRRLAALAAAGRLLDGALCAVTEKGMFDYATGKWAPAKFHNYVTGEWITGVPSTDVTIPVGTLGSGAGPQLCADCARGMGRAEVAEWRRKPCAERTGDFALSPLGRRPGSNAHKVAMLKTPTSSTIARSTSTPPSRVLRGLCLVWRHNGSSSDCARSTVQSDSLNPGAHAARVSPSPTNWLPSTNLLSTCARRRRPAAWMPKQKPACFLNWTPRSPSFSRRLKTFLVWIWFRLEPTKRAHKAADSAVEHR